MLVLALVFLVTNRPDDALHDKGRVFAFCLVVLVILLPALLLYLRSRGTGAALVLGAAAGLVVALVAIGYPLQRHYLENRFANDGAADERIPGMHLDDAYRWARGIEDARIGLAGTTAGFAGYGFYGTDLSNRVRYLGEDGPHGAFNAIPTCAGFRTAVNDADLDYLVTAPYPQLPPPGRPGRIPGGALAARRERRAAAPAQRARHRLESRRGAVPRRLRSGQRAAAPDPTDAVLIADEAAG